MRRRHVLWLWVGFAAAGAAPGAHAATITVNTPMESFTGNDGLCSLRQAVIAANNDAPSGPAAGECAAGDGVDTVAVPAGEFLLTAAFNPAVVVGSDLTISGAGAGETVVRPGGSSQVFRVTGTFTDVTFERLTVAGGIAPGGPPGTSASGLSALGTSGGPGANGGGIASTSNGLLRVVDAAITANTAGAGGGGGHAIGSPGAPGDDTCAPRGSGFAGGGGAGGHGGGIYHEGAVLVRDSVFTENHAGAGGPGGNGSGGAGGTLQNGILTGCDGGDGHGGGGGLGGSGGAIYALGLVTIERSVFTANAAGAGGPGGVGAGGAGGPGSDTHAGGAGGDGDSQAGGPGGSGGAIAVASPGGSPPGLSVAASTFEANVAGAGGAGGSATGGQGGSAPTVGFFGGNATGAAGGAGGEGGAIRPAAGAASIADSLFGANRSGRGGDGGAATGGDGGDGQSSNAGGDGSGGDGGNGGRASALVTHGTTALLNSTFTGNVARVGGSGGAGSGGDGGDATSSSAGSGGAGNGGDGGDGGAATIEAVAESASLRHVTIAGNEAGGPGAPGVGDGGSAGAPAGGTDGAGDAGDPGAAGPVGGIRRGAAAVTVAGSVIAANLPVNCAGTLTDAGGLIRFGDATCPGTTADPLLGPLAANGGATRTLALAPASPARDVAPDAGCPPADARGVPRPRGAACDAGAYEVAPPDVVTGEASGVSGAGATLTGSVVPFFRDPTYRFEFGTTAAYGSATATGALAGGLGPVAVSATLSGLAPGTTYHYRLVAENGDGSTAGVDRTFTTADRDAPAFLSASMRPRRFAVRRGGATEIPVSAAKRGTRFRFELSEDARVVFAIARRAPGRRVEGRCVKPKRSNRSEPRCKRWKVVGRFAVEAEAGANKKRFSGRIGSKRLKPGRHRASLVATDAAGNASAPKRLRFRVVRR